MLKHNACIGLLVIATIVSLGRAADTKSQTDKKTTLASPEETALLARVGEVIGILEKVNAKDGTFVLRVEYPRIEVDQAALRRLNTEQQRLMQDMIRQQQQIQHIRARNPAEYQRQFQRIVSQHRNSGKMKNLKNPYKVVAEHKHFEIGGTEQMVVRTMKPGLEYDDKGIARKLSDAELKKLKGPGNLPGYTAALADLAPGQVVRMAFNPAKAGEKNPFADRTLVTRIIILAEGNPSSTHKP